MEEGGWRWCRWTEESAARRSSLGSRDGDPGRRDDGEVWRRWRQRGVDSGATVLGGARPDVLEWLGGVGKLREVSGEPWGAGVVEIFSGSGRRL